MASDYKPLSPSQYKEDQIILNSGRLLFNSKSDAILMFAPKAIGLSSAGTINLDSDNDIILNAAGNTEKGKINLGLNAVSFGEPVLLGNKTCDRLTQLLGSLVVLCQTLSTAMKNVQPAQPDCIEGLAYLNTQFDDILRSVSSDELKSKKTYTL